MSAVDLREVAPQDAVLQPLIAAHIAHSAASSPATSNYALDAAALAATPGLRAWVAEAGGQALGCAALKPLPGNLVELKSVHVLPAGRGRGIGRALTAHVIDAAQRAGHAAIVLETGPAHLPAYDAARRLYEGLGFRYCGPIPGYGPDPNSAFMRRDLDGSGPSAVDVAAAAP